MRRNGVIVLGILALLGGMAAGCQAKPSEAPRPGTAPNEVLTLREVPEDKLLITMRVEDGMNSARLESAIETQFDKVDIVTVANTPSALDYENDQLQDIFCSTYASNDKTDYASKLLDLAGEDFAQNYHANALNGCSRGDVLPYLPGPANIYGIIYDKELFAENGWEVPSTLDEFLKLCQTIQATGLRPLQPALYYTDAVRQLFAGFSYEPIFAGIDNFAWLKSYQAGEATMAGHIELGLEIMTRLMDAGALQPGDFEVQPSTRSGMMYSEHCCAMILEAQLAPIFAQQIGKDKMHEVGMMPFYSGGVGTDYLFSIPNFYIGANARLEEPGNEEKLETVLDILAWISTPEGQQAIIDPEAPMISSVKGVPLFDSDFLSQVSDTIEKGHVVPQPFWFGSTGSAVDRAFRESLAAWSRGELTAQALVAACDEARDQALSSGLPPVPSKIGTAKTDFTTLETSLYFAALFQEEMGATIGLCLSNSRQCGNNVKFYEGDLTVGGAYTLDTYLARCFSTDSVEEERDRQLQMVLMTGQQILDALNHPPEQGTYPNRYYAASGLQIEFAPWGGEGERYLSVKLEDGTALDPETEYTVAIWNGSIREEYIGTRQAQSPNTALDLLIRDVTGKGEIAPFTDGRFLLNWDRDSGGK